MRLPASPEILVIKTTSLGDVLHGTSVLPILKKNFPDCRITWVVDRAAHEIVRQNPLLTRVIVSDFRSWQRRWWREPVKVLREMLTLLAEIRDTRYALVLDIQGLLRTVVLLLASRSRRKFVKGRWPLLPGFGDKKNLHALVEIRRVLDTAGLTTFEAPMAFATGEREKAVVDALWPAQGRVVLVSPFTGWPSKTWSATHFAEVIRRLPRDLNVFITGDAPSRQAAEGIARESGHPRVRNLCGDLSLAAFACLAARSHAMLSGESFAAHVASAVDLPVVILFGPTDERRVGPVGRRFRILRAPDCRRCYKPRCRRRCLDSIPPQDALAALEEMLSAP